MSDLSGVTEERMVREDKEALRTKMASDGGRGEEMEFKKAIYEE